MIPLNRMEHGSGRSSGRSEKSSEREAGAQKLGILQLLGQLNQNACRRATQLYGELSIRRLSAESPLKNGPLRPADLAVIAADCARWSPLGCRRHVNCLSPKPLASLN